MVALARNEMVLRILRGIATCFQGMCFRVYKTGFFVAKGTHDQTGCLLLVDHETLQDTSCLIELVPDLLD